MKAGHKVQTWWCGDCGCYHTGALLSAARGSGATPEEAEAKFNEQEQADGVSQR